MPTRALRQVVFVHGLGGDMNTTWTAHKGWRRWHPDVFWPDWLAEDVSGTVVWSLGYGASRTYWNTSGAAMALPDRAANVLPTLISSLSNTEGDIIFVGYSLGGLVVNATLRLAEIQAPHDSQIASLLRRVRGIVQLGTPNSGAGLATLGTSPVLSWLVRPRETVKNLPRDDWYLRDLNTWFRSYIPAKTIAALVISERRSDGLAGLVVQPSSADPGLGPSVKVVPVDEDHSSLTHPKSRDSDVYRQIANFIRSPLSGPHPDTLHSDRMQGLEDAVRGMQGGINESAAQIRDSLAGVKNALSVAVVENPFSTREASQRLTQLKHARLVPGFDAEQASKSLLHDIEFGELATASSQIRQSIFAWSSRVLAAHNFEAASLALQKAMQFGDTEETKIANAFLKVYETEKDKNLALAIISGIRTPASFTASLLIVAIGNNPDDTMIWLDETGLAVDQFDADGKYRIIVFNLGRKDWDAALKVVNSLTEQDFIECPGLLFVAAHVHLGQTVHADLREELELPLPQDLSGFYLNDDGASISHRLKAIELYKKAAVAFKTLHADTAVALASDKALWLELRDPSLKPAALKILEDSMADERVRLRRIPLALAFNLGLNLQAVEHDIDRATALSGGKSVEASAARFALAMHRKAQEIPDYIVKHREQLIQCYQPAYIDSIAIEGFARSGRIDEARRSLADIDRSMVTPSILKGLERLIDYTASGDAVSSLENEYKANKNIANLINLVSELKCSRDFLKLSHYSGELFDKTKNRKTAETFVGSLYEIGKDSKILEFAVNNPEILETSIDIKSISAWAYFREGRLNEASALLSSIRTSRDTENDRHLALNIAVASGDWSSLSTFVESEWNDRSNRKPGELLRAGIIAQRIGSPRSRELVHEAARNADSNAQILVNCYETATSAGWEDDKDTHDWLTTAIANSGTNGPIQQIDLRDLLDQQPDWKDRIDRTWDLLVKGQAPIFAAGQVANRTLLDLFLRPALQNMKEADARRRSVIFAFSGAKPIQLAGFRRLAVDVTSLLTFALTGLMQKVIDRYDVITISHSTLGWLFEERSKLAFHQPSMVRRAREVKRLIDDKDVFAFESTAPLLEVEHEVGEELARYLDAAKTIDDEDVAQKIIIRPFPLRKVGTLLDDHADIRGYESYFAGCTDVLDALTRAGQLTAEEKASALSYLNIHEKPWPHNPSVQGGATLYLDDLAVSYLQHLKLLPRLAQAGFKVYVTSSEADRARELMRFDDSASEARQVVEELQIILRDGISSGKVCLGKLVPSDDKDERLGSHPTRMMIAEQPDVDAVVIDDRFVNMHMTMGKATVMTSVDVIADLGREPVISQSEMELALTKIRRAGMIFVPHRIGEIEALINRTVVSEGRLQESAELRAIREATDRARMTEALQLPQEAMWMDTLIKELLSALRAQWNEGVSDDLARARSEWILDLLDVRGWAHRGASTAITAPERYRSQIMAILISPSLIPTVRARYQTWLDEAVLRRIKQEDPKSYEQMLANIQQIIEERSAVNIEKFGVDDE